MKTIPLFFLLSLCLTVLCKDAAAQSTTSKGTEFWTTWMNHINGATGSGASQMSLYITSDVATTGTVEVADGSSPAQNFTVTANQVTTINIAASAYVGTEGSFTKGIHITAAKPIAVYAHIYASNVSGATLLLPVNTLGKNYYSLNYTQLSNSTNSYSSFAVVATENNTAVEIIPAAALLSGKPAKTAYTVTLNKGQVYQGLSNTDLTGTQIKSISAAGETCKKIAVFSGSGKIGIGCSTVGAFTSDNLFQQVYPTAAWGKNFVTVPLKSRNYDVFRIVASDPTTNVTLNGVTLSAASASFVNHFYYEFSSTTTNVISADKPIQVIQYAVTQGRRLNCVNDASDVGDPEMIYLTPIEQSLDQVTLYSTNKYLITKNFINVIIPTVAAGSFTLDGSTAGVTFTPVAGTSYSYAQLSVASGTHTIKASQGFNAIAYGFGATESYGYAAGTNLQNLNEYISLKNTSTDNTSITGCKGDTYNLQVSIPFQTTSIKWDLKDGTPPVTQNNPTVSQTVVKDGKTLYVYNLAQPIVYNTPGNYSVVATVFNPLADDCGSYDDIQFDFDVSDVPVAAFDAPAAVCPADVITFKDQSVSNGVNIKTWNWDFGDTGNATTANPNTSSVQNPTHFYTKTGDYQVSLTIINDNGCSSTITHAVHVNALPQASFTASTPDCATQVVTFTDTSTPGDGTNEKWDWDFGDTANTLAGNPNNANTKNAQHIFTAPGSYKVTLTVTSSTGCVSAPFTKLITINATPQVDFALPDACVNDNTKFTNTTTISDGTDAQLTYLWNFNDPASGAANTSALKEPQHHFTHAGNFNISLTVTSANNCVVTKTQSFTVNGDTPMADFEVLNAASLCSANDVVFHDKSSVNFGSITKLVWYFDLDGQPNQFETFTKDQFTASGNYNHNYGAISSAHTYRVKLLAYSGDACQSFEKIISITVNPSPVVALTPIGPLCEEDSPLQITATPANGVAGTSTFTGKGISTSGWFNPANSGTGTFTINYNFVAANACDYSSTLQVIVHATPTLTVEPELHLLEGGQVKLNATAAGVAPLTYKWTLANGDAAPNLDHNDIAQPTASPVNDITYMLTVTSAEGCSKSATVKVSVLKAPVIPNTFTPNGDGYNDKWDIKYLDSYPNCLVEVYNRYGEKLYSSNGYNNPWDGTFRGAALPVGTYYYIINPKNGRKVISGSVTIIR